MVQKHSACNTLQLCELKMGLQHDLPTFTDLVMSLALYMKAEAVARVHNGVRRILIYFIVRSVSVQYGA
jgi:hypothetical protein